MRSKTPSFITEIPLSVDQAQERTLFVRLDCARQVYNACLGEALKRATRMKASPEYAAAKKLPRGTKQRSETCAAVRKQFGFREYDLHAYATGIGKCWLGDHLDSNTIQKVATRAFQAVLRCWQGRKASVQRQRPVRQR
jgi:hypothetical protein